MELYGSPDGGKTLIPLKVNTDGSITAQLATEPTIDIGTVQIEGSTDAGATWVPIKVAADGTVAVSATALDIRALSSGTDSVDVSGSSIDATIDALHFDTKYNLLTTITAPFMEFTHLSFTVAATPASPILSANGYSSLLVINDGAYPCYLKFGGTAVAHEGILLNANGGSYAICRAAGNMSQQAVSAIALGGSTTLLVTNGSSTPS